LLEDCAKSGTQLSLIIAAMVCYGEDFDQCPDAILNEVIKKFASDDLKQPLLKLNSGSSGSRVDVFLTEFGKAVLASEENHVKTNGVDSWIGGVHLKSEYGSPWSYDQVSGKLL